MIEWIDLNAPYSRQRRQLGNTLCESRIARPAKSAVARIAQSEHLLRVKRAIPAILDTLAWFATWAAGVASALLLALLLGWRIGQ